MPRTPVTSWGMSRRIEEQYNRSLQNLRRQIVRELSGAGSPQEISRRLQVIANSPQFTNLAQSMANNMARQVYRESGVHWRKLAQEANRRRGAAMYRALLRELDSPFIGGVVEDIIIDNANLIKTIPIRLDASMASLRARNSAFAGARSESLVEEIKPMISLSAEKLAEAEQAQIDHELEIAARRIARTETAKAQSALTQARCDALGVAWYVWRTAGDGLRVRDSHRHMEGVLVAWSNPPNPETLIGKANDNGPYHAGNIWNCRCYSEPVIDIDWLYWPHKAFINGEIRKLTKNQFREVM